MLIALYCISMLLSSHPVRSEEIFCACRPAPGDREYELCYSDIFPDNPYGIANLAGSNIIFQGDSENNCIYFLDLPLESYDSDLFPECRAACLSAWAENAGQNIFFDSSVSVSPNDRYIIPYCYAMTQAFIYEVLSINPEGSFSLKHIINVPRGIDALRLFKDWLVILDSEELLFFSMKPGEAFRKRAAFPLPHERFKFHFLGPSFPAGEVPPFMLGMVMDGEYLYFLNPPGNSYGPLLTFRIESGEVSLLDGGLSMPKLEGEWAIRNNVQINEAYGKKYLTYFDQDCYGMATGSGIKYLMLFRLENHLPLFARRDALQCLAQDHEFGYNFKNYYLYEYSAGGGDNPCPMAIHRFEEDETLPIINYDTLASITQGPDAELIDYFGRGVSCETDEAPIVEYLIFPDIPVSQNFLVMGRARDAEGIRSVFAGYPYCRHMERAALFQQADGSVIWTAVLRKISPYDWQIPWPWCDATTTEFAYMTYAEDSDGDSNHNLDVPFTHERLFIQFKGDPDPAPIGSVETSPCGTESTLVFSGWAVDNSGIRQGWLLSEDAQVLVPLTTGLDRPDIAEQYPDYPDALHSGFGINYDLCSVPDGQYEFTVRLLANDYQVLDFGPYVITLHRSHSRPVSPP